MTDVSEPEEVEAPAVEAPLPPKTKRIVRRPAAKPSAPVAPPSSSGGFVGLWKTLTGKQQGATAIGDTGLTFAFVTCFFLGFVLCLVGAFEVPFSRQIGFGGPLIATAAYPLWGLALGAHVKPSLRERLADNSYYLGFIFTQVALLVGFLPAAFGIAELSADQIIRFFGVALGASLIGLIARTILIQMSYTVDEAADVVSGEVSALARQVTEQTSLVLDQFDQLVERLATSQVKLVTDLHGGMTELARTVSDYNRSLQFDAAILHKGATAASGAAEQTSLQLEQNRERLTNSIEAVGKVIDQLRQSMEKRVEAATQSIEETTGAVQRGLHALPNLQSLDRAVGIVGERIASLGDNVSGVDDRVSNISATFEQSMRSLETELEEVKRDGIDRAATVTTEANDAIAALEQTLQHFRQELDRLRG